MDQTVYRPDDRFQLRCYLSNAGPSVLAEQFVILDVWGDYWFWPSWRQDLDFRTILLDTDSPEPTILLDFDWPSGAGSAQGILLWAALLDPIDHQLAAPYDWVEFAFAE